MTSANLDKLVPPPAGTQFAVTDLAGQHPGLTGEEGCPAVLWIADRSAGRHRHFWVQYLAGGTELRGGLGYPEHTTFRVRRMRLGFESGWTVSIIWGSATYSTNHDSPFGGDAFTETPTTVELAVLDRDGYITPEGDPFSYVGAEQALAIIDCVSSWSSDPADAAALSALRAG